MTENSVSVCVCGRQKAGRAVIAAAVGIIYFCGGPNSAISRPKEHRYASPSPSSYLSFSLFLSVRLSLSVLDLQRTRTSIHCAKEFQQCRSTSIRCGRQINFLISDESSFQALAYRAEQNF